MSFLLSLKSSYIKNKRSWKRKENIPFQSPVYERVCFGYLPWLSVTVICCVWCGAWQTEGDVPLEAIKACEIGQLAMQTSLRSISSTFGSWLGTENGNGRKKISLDTCKSFGGNKKKKALNVRHGNMKLSVLAPLVFTPLRSPSSFAGMAHTPPSTPYLTELLMKCHVLLPSGRRSLHRSFIQRCKNDLSVHPSVLQTEIAYPVSWMIPVWKDKKGKAVSTLLLCCCWTFHEFQPFPPVMCCSSWDFSPAQEGTGCASCTLPM